MTELVVSDLTQSTLEGTGVFDVLMRSTKTHLEAEFSKNRIKGAEYATVYLGSLESVMRTSMEFLLQKQRIGLEAQLLEQQILLAQIGLQKANVELAILQSSLLKIPAEIAQLEAQTALTNQQKTNLVAEGLNIPKQGALLDAQGTLALKQVTIADAEISIKQQQVLISQAELGIAQAKLVNIPKEGLQLEAQTALIVQQKVNLITDELANVAKTALTTQQKANAVIEGTVLTATECKLRAEFDVLMTQKLKGASENSLLLQKVETEKAQVTALGVDDNSVVGRQKSLYLAQTDGFKRDAEQKATKILIDTWNVRKTADSGATGVVVLDADIVAAVSKLKTGIGA